MQRLPFAYRNTFPLVDGDYQLRIVFKNRARNDYTLLESEVRVPERRRGEVLLGEPVLLYNVEELGSTQGPGFRIYELGSLRLHPNAKRVYAIGEPVRFHVPLAGASPNHQLRLQIASMENTSAPLQSKSTSLADYADGPIIETLELAEAVGGRYRLEVALVDPSGELVASQFAELDVTPRNAVSRPWVMYGTNDFAHPATVLAALAAQHLERGDRARAKALYEQALEQKPDLPQARRSLAQLHLDDGDAPRAISLLTLLYEETPESYDVVVSLAEAHHQMGELSRAAQLFERALQLRGPEPRVLNALASCQAGLGNEAKAVEYLEQSLVLLPDQEGARELLKRLKGAETPKK